MESDRNVEQSIVKSNSTSPAFLSEHDLVPINGHSQNGRTKQAPKRDSTGAKERASEITKEEYEEFRIGGRTADDEISPDSFQIRQGHVIINHEIFSETDVLSFNDVKAEPTGFYEDIYSRPGVTTSIHLKQIRKALAQFNLRRLKSQLSTAIDQRVSAKKPEDADLQKQFDEVHDLDKAISDGKENVFKASVYIRFDVEGEDEKDGRIKLRESKRGVLNTLKSLPNKVGLRTPFLRSSEAFQSTLLLADDKLGEHENTHTSFVGAMYPWSTGQIVDEKGVWMGVTRGKKPSAVFFDCWDSLDYNGNGIILGEPGTGKSATLKTWALRHILHGKRVFVLDAAQQGMREYEQACTMVGGTYVRMGPNTPNRINFLEVSPYNPDDDEQSNPYDDQMEMAPEFLRFIIQDPAGENNARAPYSLDEESVIRRALERMYNQAGIYRDEPENFANRKMPVLNDLRLVLEQMAERGDDELDIQSGDFNQVQNFQKIAGRYATRIKTRMNQPSIKMFTEATNIDLDQRMVVFELGNMPKDMKPIAYTIAGKVIQDKMISDPEETVIIGDEAQIALGEEENEAANNIPRRFFGNFSERSRKLQGAFWTATHHIGNLKAAGNDGDKIMGNSRWRFIMGQGPIGITGLKESSYQFSDSDLKHISGKGKKGSGIFMRGSGLDGGTRVLLQVERIPMEEVVTSTTARDEVDANSLYLRDMQDEDLEDSADNLLPAID